MVDLTVTPANVKPEPGAQVKVGVAGETITAGMSLYLKSDGKWWKAQADGTAEEAGSAGVGCALNGASADQPIQVQFDGPYNPGATTVAGIVYVVSAAAGGIAPDADLVSTNKVTILGVGQASNKITLKAYASGAIKP